MSRRDGKFPTSKSWGFPDSSATCAIQVPAIDWVAVLMVSWATWLDWAIAPVLSEDGTMLEMTENDQATHGKDAVYIRGTNGSPAARLGEGSAISLSPDGR
jgi:hypothetical protein